MLIIWEPLIIGESVSRGSWTSKVFNIVISLDTYQFLLYFSMHFPICLTLKSAHFLRLSQIELFSFGVIWKTFLILVHQWIQKLLFHLVASYLNFDHKGVLSLNLTSSAWLPNYCIQINEVKREISVLFSDLCLIGFEFHLVLFLQQKIYLRT